MDPHVEVTVMENALLITAELPGLRSEHIEITFEGQKLRISSSQPDGHGPFESEVEVPPEYDPCVAEANFSNGKLRIEIPAED